MSDIKLINSKIDKAELKRLVDTGFKDMVGETTAWKS